MIPHLYETKTSPMATAVGDVFCLNYLSFVIKRSALELEVDERLDIAALHLNDDVDDCNDEQCTDKNVCSLHSSDDALLPGVGQIMGDKRQRNQHEYEFVAFNHLQEQFRVERSQHLL